MALARVLRSCLALRCLLIHVLPSGSGRSTETDVADGVIADSVSVELLQPFPRGIDLFIVVAVADAAFGGETSCCAERFGLERWYCDRLTTDHTA